MQKLRSLNKRSLLALVLCCCLVCGCLPLSFSANAATVSESLPATFSYYPYLMNDGLAHVGSTNHTKSAIFNIDPTGGTITISRGGNMGGATPWWEVACFEQPVDSSSTGHFLAKVTTDATGDIVVTVPPGYSYLLVNACVNATSSTAITITISYETIDVPDLPSYEGATGGSSSVVTGIQQGLQFDNVSVDTVTSQLTGQLVQESVVPVYADNDEGGVPEYYYFKSVYRVPVLVSCVITNRNGRYAWLDAATIGYAPQFFQSIGIMAEAATSYELCDIFYTSEGFADAVLSDGTVHFRFNDDNYYLGTVIVAPYASISASALLYYDISIVTKSPSMDGMQDYLQKVQRIMRTSVMNSVSLSGIAGVNQMLNKIPTGATTDGQDEIIDSVGDMSTAVTGAVNDLKTQQQQQFVEFTAPADSNSLGNTFTGFEEQIAGIGFYALTQDIIRRVDDLIKSEPPPAELTFPAFGLEISGVYHQLWEPYTFSFTDWGENFPSLVSAVHFATLGVLCFWLVRYCNKLVHKIWGAA